MKSSLFLCTLIVCVAITLPARAHHSFGEFDLEHLIVIEGKLLEVSWVNPHVHLKLQSADKDGRAVVWDVETNSFSALRRSDLTKEDFQVGESVKLFGAPSKLSSHRFAGASMLRPNGQELVLFGGFIKPHWTNNVVGAKTAYVDGGTTANPDSTIFHVWGSKYGDQELPPPNSIFSAKDYPLTQAASKALGKWDPVKNYVTTGCIPKGMPTIMDQPYPIEFVQQGDRILLHIEESDVVRTIHMTGGTGLQKQPKTPLGYSTGHWEGRTLVVTTDRIGWRYFNQAGIPLGTSTVIVERFTPSANGSRLDYTIAITDPETFAKPFEGKGVWVWRPGEQVKPYNCTVTASAR